MPQDDAALIAKLRRMARMIPLGERIPFGSDSDLMDEAADRLTDLRKENDALSMDVNILRPSLGYTDHLLAAAQSLADRLQTEVSALQSDVTELMRINADLNAEIVEAKALADRYKEERNAALEEAKLSRAHILDLIASAEEDVQSAEAERDDALLGISEINREAVGWRDRAQAAEADRDRYKAALEDMTKDRDAWKQHWELYKNAWMRCLNGQIYNKTHLIDGLVKTTTELQKNYETWKAVIEKAKDDLHTKELAATLGVGITAALLKEAEKVIGCAQSLVALWKSQKVTGLPRSERNAAIEEIRDNLITTVEDFAKLTAPTMGEAP